jgi:hypothetical protein
MPEIPQPRRRRIVRVISWVFVCLSFSLVSAQEEKTKNPQQEQQKIPTTLAEAHAELERVLSPQILTEIDAMPSEDGMIQYHMGLGASIRAGWGLSRGSPLAKHMQELGFDDPDEISSVILATFWCKRHGQDFRLQERTPAYQEAIEAAQKARAAKEQEDHVQKAKAALRSMMIMGLLSAVLLLSGLACLAIAKVSRCKEGAWLSSGSAHMSKGYAGLCKIAYVLMGVGVLVMLLVLNALRTTG